MDKSQLLGVAIQKEAEAQRLYENAGKRIRDPGGKKLLEELATEEGKHRAMLEGLPPEQAEQFQPDETQDSRIGDYLKPTSLDPESSVQDVLIYAIKREEAARHFYSAMAAQVKCAALKPLLKKLAAMEKSHKARLERFYEDVFLKEM